MYSAFHSTRLVIRAVLISSLLVFGHTFTLISSSRRLLLHAPSDFEAPIRPMSALVAATILWLSFTLLELVDVVEDNEPPSSLGILPAEECELPQHEHAASRVLAWSNPGPEPLTGQTEDTCMFFCRTEVELGIGLALLIEWTVYWKQALFVIFYPIPISTRDLILLKVSYVVIIAGLAALSLQLLVSLALHLLRNGCNVIREDVWGARTGQWAFRGTIKLEEEETSCTKEFAIGVKAREAVQYVNALQLAGWDDS